MSAGWVDDEPVAYALTDAADRLLDGWLTTSQAARLTGVLPQTLNRRARQGRIPASRLDDGRGGWAFRRSDLEAYAEKLDHDRRTAERETDRLRARARPGARRPRGVPPSREYLSAEPLLVLIAARGGYAASGLGASEKRTLQRARRCGRLTREAADRYAVRLGLTPWEVWHQEWDVASTQARA